MSTATLSPAVIRVGGAMEKVFENTQPYVGYQINKRVQTAIVQRLIEGRPALNNEQSLVKILDLATFHGISQMVRLGKQIDEYGLPTVHLAVEFLFEYGERGRSGDKTNQLVNGFGMPRRYMTGMDSVDRVAELIIDLSALAASTLDSVEQVGDLVTLLGGLNKTLDMSTQQLANALEAEFDLSPTDVEDAEEDDESTGNA